MPTVIDSLIVTLGLDPKNFNDQQKKTSETWLKTVVGFQKGGKQVEESSKRAAETVNLITRRVLELFAVLTGSRALSDFASTLVNADAALGRFASNLGVTPQRLSEMQHAAELFGGSAEGAAGMLERMNKGLYDITHGGYNDSLARLHAWTGMQIDTKHGINNYVTTTLDALRELQKTDPSTAHKLAQDLGVDPATEAGLKDMKNGYDAFLKSISNRDPSNAAIVVSEKLQKSWVGLTQQAIALGNAILEKVGPAILDIIDKTSKWVDTNQEWIRTGIGNAFKAVYDFVSSHWPIIVGFVEHLAGIAKTAFGYLATAVNAVGGVNNATDILLGLWIGSKFTSALANMYKMAAAYGLIAGAAGVGGAGSAAGGGLLAGMAALLGRLSPWLAMLTLSGDTPQGQGVYYTDRDIDAITGMKHYDGSGPQNQNHRRPGQDSGGGIGGLWSSIVSGIGRAFGGGGSTGGLAGAAGGDVGALAGPRKGGSRSWRNNNPGNVEYSPFARAHGATGSDGRFAIFPSYDTGRKAQEALLFDSPGYRNLTLGQAIGRWAPGTENNVPAYIKAMGGDSGTRMSAYTPQQRARLLDAMQRHEGWRPGLSPTALLTGAKAAALSSISSTHNATTSNSSVEAHIGKVEVHSQAIDANGIAADISNSLRRRLFSDQSDIGLA